MTYKHRRIIKKAGGLKENSLQAPGLLYSQ